MQYTARLPFVPSPRSLVGPAAALAVGAAVATGAWGLIDNETIVQEPPQVIVVDSPSAGEGAASKHEAATAAAIGNPPSQTAATKNEAATAAAISNSSASKATTAKDEAATAAAISGGSAVELRGSKASQTGASGLPSTAR